MQFMNEGMPRVSYTKALDVWMSVCLFFIFAGIFYSDFLTIKIDYFTKLSNEH